MDNKYGIDVNRLKRKIAKQQSKKELKIVRDTAKQQERIKVLQELVEQNMEEKYTDASIPTIEEITAIEYDEIKALLKILKLDLQVACPTKAQQEEAKRKISKFESKKQALEDNEITNIYIGNALIRQKKKKY